MGRIVLIRRLCVPALVPLMWMCVQVAAVPLAVADDNDTQIGVGTGDGQVNGRLDVRHPGNSESSGGSSDSSRRSSSDDSSSSDSGKGCRKVRTVTDIDPCGYGDVTAVPVLGVTPPSAVEVRVALHLPDPTPRFGPDPGVNEWKMLVVGYPVWLWTDGPSVVSATATHDGLTMTLTAEWTSTSFEMGDGHTVTCTRTTQYPEHPDEYGMPSPTCGYTYQKRSKPGHDYTVTATTHWLVTWTAGGRSGALTTTYARDRTLRIGELQALVKG